MSLVEELMEIEKQLWTSGPSAYLEHVDDRCLVAFGGIAQIMTKAEVAESVRHSQRWQPPQVKVRGAVEPTQGSAIMTYEVDAIRASGDRYSAVVSSGYAKRDGRWKLVFHQQTPIPGAGQ